MWDFISIHFDTIKWIAPCLFSLGIATYIFKIYITHSVDKYMNDGLEKQKELFKSENKSIIEIFNETSAALGIPEEQEKLIKNYTHQINSLKHKIKELDEDLNKARSYIEHSATLGIGNYFSRKNKEVKLEMFLWLSLFIISIFSMFYLGHSIYNGGYNVMRLFSTTMLSEKSNLPSFDAEKILLRYTLFVPIIWFAWFSAKRFTQTSKIREDYSYKAVLTMTYDAYNRSESPNEELRQQIILATLSALKQNPVHLLEKKEACTPAQELAELLKEVAKYKDNS